MAKTSYNKIVSQSILSAHINGLASGINNVEEVLNMKTESLLDKPMLAVNDMEDIDLHNLIFESQQKGFVSNIVIKRNNTVVPTNEYSVQGAFGVVVFNEPQPQGVMITISGDVIVGKSTLIESVNQDISALKTDVEQLKNNSGGGGTNPPTEPTEIAIDGYMAGGGQLVNGKMVIPQGDVWVTHSTSKSPTVASGVTVASNQIDAFPIYFEQRVVLDSIRIDCAKNNYPTAQNIMGIYSCANGLPHRRLAQTEVYADVLGVSDKPFRDGEVRLEAGTYWVVRNSTGGQQYNGIVNTSAIPLEIPTDMSKNASGGNGIAYGLRADSNVSANLPFEFPLSSCKALIRSTYASPYLHIKKSYV